MSNSVKLLSQLQPSTKITVSVCASFLVLTAGILLCLMVFPIEPHHETLQAETPVTEYLPPETTEYVSGAVTEPPHTLSTWSASVEGYVKATGGYPVETGRDRNETTDYAVEETQGTTEFPETTDDTESPETSTAVFDETTTGDGGNGTEEQTETIPQQPDTEPPTEPPTEPEVTDPPPIEPILPEDVPGDVIVD